MPSAVTQVYSLLQRVESVVLSIIMLTMVVLYGTNVGVRTFVPSYASSFAWIDEATRFLLVWSVFLALGAALERGRHVAMASFFEQLPDATKRLVGRLIDVVGFGFSLYIAMLSFDIAIFVGQMGQQSPTLGISMAWLYAVVPAGMVLLALRFAIRFVRRADHPDGFANTEAEASSSGLNPVRHD